MQLDLDAMNAQMLAKCEECMAKCPDVPPLVIGRAVKAAILAGKVVEHLAAKGKAITPEMVAKAFVECLKRGEQTAE